MTLRASLLLALAGLCLTLVARHPMFVIGSAVLFGGAVVVSLRPSLVRLWTDRRRPVAEEIEALVLGLIAALGLWLLSGLFFSDLTFVVNWADPSTRDWTGQVLTCLPLLALILSLARRRLRAQEGGFTPSSGSAVAAIPLCIGGLLLWHTAISPLTDSIVLYQDRFHAVILCPFYVFLMVFGGALMARGVREKPIDISAVSLAVTASIGTWAALVLLTVLDMAGLSPAGRFSNAEGGMIGSVYLILIAVGWIRGLWSLRRLEPSRPAGAAATVTILGIAMPLSLAIPTLVVGATWGDLVGVVMFPFALASVAMAVFVPPLLSRRLLRP